MRRSTAWRYVVVALLGGGVIACGLGVVASGAGEGGEDAATVVPQDGASAGETGVNAIDARVDQHADCVPAVVVDDPLTTISVLTWQTYSSQADYPAAHDAGTGTLMAAINASMKPSQNAGLWLRQAVPTTAFDVSFDYLIRCKDDAYCADGLAAAWLDTTDAAALEKGNPGKELGIPKLAGGAAAIKLDVKLSDPDLNEDTFPTLMVHAMDAGTSNKTPTTSLRGDALVGEVRRVKMRLRKGQLTVDSTNDAGTSISVTGPTRSGFLGHFGFTASTGVHFDAAYVGSFHGEFYACEPH